MRFSCTKGRYGLRSSKECVSPTLSMQLSVSQLLAYRTVYNHPRDAIVGTVYNHPSVAFPLHSVCNYYVPVLILSDSLQPSNGRLPLALSMQLSVSWSLAYWRFYNHPRNAFLLLWARNCWSPSCWPIGRSIISQGMRFSYTGYAIIVVGLLYGLQSSKDAFLLHWACCRQFPCCWTIGQSTIIQDICFSCSEYAIVGLSVAGLSDGLQSSKGCVLLALDMQLSVWFTIIQRMRFFCTGYAIVGTVYNHPRTVFLLHWVCNCRSLSRWPIAWSTITQRNHFSCTEDANSSFLVVDLSDGL